MNLKRIFRRMAALSRVAIHYFIKNYNPIALRGIDSFVPIA